MQNKDFAPELFFLYFLLTQFVESSFTKLKGDNRIGGVMVSVLASSVVYRGFKPNVPQDVVLNY